MLVQAWVQLAMKDPLLEELALREKLVFAATKVRLLKLSHLMVCVCVCVCVCLVCLFKFPNWENNSEVSDWRQATFFKK